VLDQIRHETAVTVSRSLCWRGRTKGGRQSDGEGQRRRVRLRRFLTAGVAGTAQSAL